MTTGTSLLERVTHNVTVCLAAVALFGCAAEVDTETSADPDDPNNIFYTQTIVELSPDGNHRVLSITEVSLAQQIAWHEAEESGLMPEEFDSGMQTRALTSSALCLSGQLRIYDQTNYAGNALCLTGTGSANLGNWCRIPAGGGGCMEFWGDNGVFDVPDIHSYKTGSYNALFSDSDQFWCSGCTVTTPASTSVADSVTCAEGAAWVRRSGFCKI